MAELKGYIKTWNDAKGFGFVRPADGGTDVFAHISAMRGERRPKLGDEVLYVVKDDDDGRPRATHLRLASDMTLDHASIRIKPRMQRLRTPTDRQAKIRLSGAQANVGAMSIRNWLLKPAVFLALCVTVLLGGATLWRQGTTWVLALYGAASLVSFFQYWLDKHNALSKQSRISEATLHVTEALGGWPGALIAQQVFRHKTRKVSYRVVFWLIVVAHQTYWLYSMRAGFTPYLLGGR